MTMPNEKNEKASPMNVSTCDFFDHKLNPHIHACVNPENKSKRCGYGVDDVKTCPIVGKIVDKVIRPLKTLSKAPDKAALKKPETLTKVEVPEPLQKPSKSEVKGVAKVEVVPTSKEDPTKAKTVAPHSPELTPSPVKVPNATASKGVREKFLSKKKVVKASSAK